MLINFKDNGKWGYYNSKTKKTIPAQFRDDSDFVDGFAIVKQYSNSLYGVIDEDGKEILPFIFKLIERQKNGLFKAGSYDFNCLYNNKGEIVDADGIALDDLFQGYDVVKPFGNDLYSFKKDATKGVIYNDKIIIEKEDPFLNYIEIIPYLYFFKLKNSYGNIRYYNYDGLNVFSDAYEIHLISDEYVVFYADYKGYGIANALGEILLPANYNEITYLGCDVFLLNYKKEQKDDDLLVKFNIKLNSFIVKDDEKEIVIPKSADWCGDFEDGKAVIASNHKYGVIDINGNICVPCNYDEVKLGYGTTVIVKDEGQFHLLDFSNSERIATYDDISPLGDCYFVYMEKGRYGVIDYFGSTIIPAKYNKDIELLDDGNIRVSIGYNDKRYCIFDSESHIVISTLKGTFHLPQEIVWANEFSEGLAIVENAQGLKGAIDELGNIVIPLRFKGNLSAFYNGESTVSISFEWHNTQSCHINKEGNFVLKEGNRLSIISGDYQLVLSSNNKNFFAYSEKWGVIDAKGNEVIPQLFDGIDDLGTYYRVRMGNCPGIVNSDGYSGNYYGIYDQNGNEILPCKYPRIDLNSEGNFEIVNSAKKELLLTINQRGKIIINNSGNKIEIPQEYDYACGFDLGYVKVRKSGVWGLIDGNAQTVIECKYTSIGCLFNGYANCFIDKMAYLVSLSNEDIIELPLCQTAKYYSENCIVLNSNRIITRGGENIAEYFRGDIGEFVNGYAILRQCEWYHNKYGLIHESGKIVIPCEYEAIKFDSELLVAHVSKLARNGWSVVNSKFLNMDNVPVLVGGKKLLVLSPQYVMGGQFVCGLAKVAKSRDNSNTDSDNIIDIISDLLPVDSTEIDLDGLDCDNFSDIGYEEMRTIHHRNMKKFNYLWGFIDESGNERITCKYDYVEDFCDGYAIVVTHENVILPNNSIYIETEKRYKGVISINGEMVVPAEYDDLCYLPNNRFKAKKNGKWGVIDKNGKIEIPLEYLDISSSSDNLFAVQVHSSASTAWGYINLQNEMIIEPKFSEAKDFSDGIAIVKDKTWKAIDVTGNVVIDCPYAISIESFADGKSMMTMQNGNEVIQHTILKNGHILVDDNEVNIDLSRISFIGQFFDGLAKVHIQDKGRNEWGFINKHGQLIITGIPDEVSDFKNGVATYNYGSYGIQSINLKGGIISVEETIASCLGSQAIAIKKLCEDRYVVVRKTDKNASIMDTSGKIIIPFNNYEYSYYAQNENYYIEAFYRYYRVDSYDKIPRVICFDLSGRRIIPDPSGHVIISDNYSITEKHFSEGFAAVSNAEEHWGFVDETGKEIIPCVFDNVYNFSNGFSIIERDYKKGIIDKTGKLILLGDYEEIKPQEDGSFIVNYYDERVCKERKFNSNGEILISLHGDLVAIPKEYDWCDEEFHEGFLSVRANDKWGVINTRFELVVECIYNEKVRFDESIAIAKSDDASVVLTPFHTLFWGVYCDIQRYRGYNLFVCLTIKGDYDIYNGFGILLFSSTAIRSRIQIPGTTKMSSNRFKPRTIIPMGYNFFKYSCVATYEKRSVKKWGICGLNGEIVLEACLDEIGSMGDGLISAAKTVTRNGCEMQLWGYVDIKGNVVIDYKYAFAQPFTHGIAKVSYTNRELGLISTDGKELTDFVYESIIEHSSGDVLAYYQYRNSSDSPVRITEQGAIHYQYFENEMTRDVYLYGYDWCSKVYHGLCIVMKGLRYGIIEESGKLTFPLIEMRPVEIAPNEDGYVCFKKWDEYKSITKGGQIITHIDEKVVELPIGIHWCDEWIDGYIAVESNNKWGLLNTKLEYVLETKYDSVQYIGNGRVIYSNKDKETQIYSIYDIDTGEYFSLPYSYCSEFMNGCAIVSKDDAYGLIDNTGQELLPCIYSGVQFKKPVKIEYNIHDDYEESHDWESDYRDAFEDEPGATWGREW